VRACGFEPRILHLLYFFLLRAQLLIFFENKKKLNKKRNFFFTLKSLIFLICLMPQNVMCGPG
jgi:hypothetical protein